MNADGKKTRRPLAVDLFSGAGGMSLGFEQAGFDVVASVELDPIHCAVHQYNFPDTKVLCRNIANVEGRDLLDIARERGGKIDVVFGGPPCQGFSMMGKRAFDDPRNSLVLEFVRIVDETQADYFVLENVKGLTVGEHRKFLSDLVEEFEKCGYAVRIPWQVLNAANFGVPQDRRRLFLLGARKNLPIPDYPAISHVVSGSGNGLFHMPVSPTVAEAICDLPDAEMYADLLDSDKVHAVFGEPSEYAAFLRGILRDPQDFSYPRRHDSTLMTSSLRTDHCCESRKRFAATHPGKIESVSRFFKLPLDGLSNTLRAGTASDRGAFTSPRPIHPLYPRCVTVREMARLHSYPDWFRFHATKWHGARQIGNSVPPLLSRAVASEVLRMAKIKPVRPRQSVPLGDEFLLKMTMQQACEYFGVPTSTIPQRNRKSSARYGATVGSGNDR